MKSLLALASLLLVGWLCWSVMGERQAGEASLNGVRVARDSGDQGAGRAAASAPERFVELAGGERVEVEPEREGGLPRAEAGALDVEDEEEGARVGVLLLDRVGRPAEGRVELYQIDADGHLVVYDRDWTDEAGLAWLDAEGARSMRVVGFVEEGAEARGRGATDWLDWSEGVPTEPLVLQVAGPGRVSGRMVDGDGEPLEGLAVTVGAVNPELPWWRTAESDINLRIDGQGWWTAEGHTDADGRFDFTGLRTGAFHLWAETGTWSGLLTPEPVAADGVERTYVMDRPRIQVRLAGGKGSLVATHGFDPDVTCVRLDQVGGERSGPRARSSRGGESQPDGSAVFDVHAGGVYVVTVFGGGFEFWQTEVDMAGRKGLVEVVADPAKSAGFGFVEVELWGPAEEHGALQLGYGVGGEIVELTTGVVIARQAASRYWDTLGSPVEFKLPAGSYRIIGRGLPQRGVHGELLSLSEYGAAQTTLTVAPDSTHSVRLDLPRAPRLEVEIVGEPSAIDLETVRSWSGFKEATDEEVWERASQVVVRADGAWGDLLYLGTVQAGGRPKDAGLLHFGEMGVATLGMASGVVTLFAESVGRRERLVQAVLQPGQTTRVQLRFDE